MSYVAEWLSRRDVRRSRRAGRDPRKDGWFTEATHNNLRITRILKSLMLTGLEDEARALHAGLAELCASEGDCAVPADTRAFWRAAVGG